MRVAHDGLVPPENAVLAADDRQAQAVAADAKDEPLGRALEAPRASLSEQVVAMGIRLPDAKAKKGGRRKKTEAA